MKIGVLKEIKNHEDRVAATPDNVRELVQSGHEVWVQSGAGVGSGLSDAAYTEAGARVTDDQAAVWDADLILKVKEPQPSEYKYFRRGMQLFTYLHLADNLELTQALLDHGVDALGYETVQLANGALPLLAPMSEVAGRAVVQIGAHYLEKQYGGKGILLGGVPGTKPGKAVIIGGGTVGMNAARIAVGMGAQVVILDNNLARLKELDQIFDGRAQVIMSNPANLRNELVDADLVVGAVLVAGGRAPVLVSEEMVDSMEDGSVIVDVAIDQGGNFATSTHSTSHSDPVFVSHGVIHYTVANIPGAVPKTATFALTNATMPYVERLANQGLVAAAEADPALAKGINTYHGHLVNQAVGAAHGLDAVDWSADLA